MLTAGQPVLGYGVAGVKSAWGAVRRLPRARFPRPLAEPGVRLSPHRALHEVMPVRC
jgi:hypothetical protein